MLVVELTKIKHDSAAQVVSVGKIHFEYDVTLLKVLDLIGAKPETPFLLIQVCYMYILSDKNRSETSLPSIKCVYNL